MIRVVLIPVAGLGSRTWPAGRVVPKEMVPLGNMPLIQYTIDHASRAGFQRAIILYRDPLVKKYFRPPMPQEKDALSRLGRADILKSCNGLNRGMHIDFIAVSSRERGSAAAIAKAAPLIREEDMVAVMFPDDFLLPGTDVLARLTQRAINRTGVWMLVVPVAERKERWGMVEIYRDRDENDFLTVKAVVEKPTRPVPECAHGIIAWFIFPAREMLRAIAETEPDRFGECSLTDVIQTLLVKQTTPVFGHVVDEPFFDAGSPGGIAAILSALQPLDAGTTQRPEFSVGRDAQVVPGALSGQIVADEETYYNKSSEANETILPVAFVSGVGSTVKDADGNRYRDLSFALNVPLGHGTPSISVNGDGFRSMLLSAGNYSTPERRKLAKTLSGLTGDEYAGWQFYSSGTEAVEGLLRYSRAISGRDGFISFEGSYHGRSHGAVSLATMREWDGTRAENIARVPYAYCYRCSYGLTFPECHLRCADEVKTAIFSTPTRPAAIVLEPVQGEAVVTPAPGFLTTVELHAREAGVPLAVDEVLTGLGRTGTMLASVAQGARPDIICLGKSLGNGFPITAVGVRKEHTPAIQRCIGTTSFGGNPLACQAALNTLSVFAQERVWQHVQELGPEVDATFQELLQSPIVGDVRGSGLLHGIEFVVDKTTRSPGVDVCRIIAEELMLHGVITTRLKHVLRLTPALNISRATLQSANRTIVETVAGFGR